MDENIDRWEGRSREGRINVKKKIEKEERIKMDG